MSRFITLVSVLSLVFCNSAVAEVIDLVCKHTNGFTLNFKINTDLGTVSSSNTPARDVEISSEAFAFILDLSGGAYYHRINRATGTLTVQPPNKSLIYGHTCERATNKF